MMIKTAAVRVTHSGSGSVVWFTGYLDEED